MIYIQYICLGVFIYLFIGTPVTRSSAYLIGGLLSPLLFALHIWGISLLGMDKENRK